MADHAPKPRRNVLPLLIAVLAVVAVVLVVTGRLLGPTPVEQPGWQDAIYSVLLAFTLDGTFLGRQNAVTLLGAFAAALVFYLALFGSLWVVFRRRLVAWRAARSRKHIVVIGDDADAEELALVLSADANVVLVSAHPVRGPGLMTIERPAATSDLIAAANIHRARSVVVMLADEKVNAAIATSIASGREGAAEPAIWCRTSDRLVADRVAAVETGAARIHVFDEAQIMAREVFARHPAHAIAERMAADRVHFAIVGFGRLGQAMAEEAIFSGIAAGLGKPMITVIDRYASASEALYRESRPALDMAADFAFINAELITAENAPALSQAALAAIAARDDTARITGILICLGSDADNVRFALALPDIRRREGRYFAPAFMRLRDPDAESVVFATAQPHVLDPNGGIHPLERPTRLVASDILDTAHRDQAARLLHAAYSAGAAISAGAATDWSHLPETFRRANRRSADHIAAKLFSIGLTSEHDAHAPILVERHAHQRHIVALQADGDERLPALAALEHRRWSADRIIDGWSYAATRDDDRKYHPLLERGDYDALPEIEQQKDRDQIRTVLSSVVISDGKGAMPETRVALAGHRNLAPAEEKRAVAALVERLIPRLASKDRVVTLVSPLAPGADMALCEAVANALMGRVGELRLIVPEAVPYRVVLDVAAREAGSNPVALGEAVMKRRRALFAKFARVDVVRIGFTGKTDDSYRRDKAQFELGLVRTNAYLVRRSDLLGVLWDGKRGRGPGGTGDLVAAWRDPASLPAALDPGPSPVRPGPADHKASLIAIAVTRDAAH
ncbi:MAG: RyR domain-containing protein [Devosia sp.]